MQKTKIEWTDMTWNPIKGLCPVGCWYCYARKMYQRFKMPKDITLHPKELEKPYSLRDKSKIFLCSTIELFHPTVSKGWRNMIFQVIEDLPQHTFQILTKFPHSIDRPMPDNVWLGCTITNSRELPRVGALNRARAKLKFISFEPLLGDIDPRYGLLRSIKWVIIGRLTGYGHKYNPIEIQLKTMFTRIRATIWHPPIFLKDNLKSIWGENLIQEIPKIKESKVADPKNNI